MPEYRVTVEVQQTRELTIRARDEQAAKEKAVEIASRWDRVSAAEAVDARRKNPW